MKRVLIAAALAWVLIPGLNAQTFDAASIRESDPALAAAGVRSSITATPGGVTIRNTTLRDAIRWAYDEPGARIGVVDGPRWADTIRYDIVARTAAAASNEQAREMLRAVLADRFQLLVRRDRRDNAVYLLTVDPRGHRLRPSQATGGRRVQTNHAGVAFEHVTMADLQQYLTSLPGLGRPVINRTALDGAFDFTLSILTGTDSDDARKSAVATGNAVTYADALKDVGLRLDPGMVPLDVITIEKAEPPTPN